MNRLHKQILLIPKRAFAYAVQHEVNGKPTEVLKRVIVDSIGKPGPKEVALKFLAAPINPSDLNMVEGVYGIKPKLPTIAGNEGVAVVIDVGNSVKNLKKGDWVIPQSAGFGTWREEALVTVDSILKIPNDIPVPYAATIGVNPCTAYRLLKDYASLHPGDYVIQNAANSMVGYSVIQIARLLGLKTINIVRSDRPDPEVTLRLLHNLGGDINIPDSYVGTKEFASILNELPPIKLALNAVGGEVVTNMARVLPYGATIVTYGGMSKRPISIPQELLNYKHLQLCGFWITEWNKQHSKTKRSLMIEDIAGWIRENQFSLFFDLHDFDDFEYALEKSLLPYQLRKIVLNLDYPDRLAEHDARCASSDPRVFDVFNTNVHYE